MYVWGCMNFLAVRGSRCILWSWQWFWQLEHSFAYDALILSQFFTYKRGKNKMKSEIDKGPSHCHGCSRILTVFLVQGAGSPDRNSDGAENFPTKKALNIFNLYISRFIQIFLRQKKIKRQTYLMLQEEFVDVQLWFFNVFFFSKNYVNQTSRIEAQKTLAYD